MDEPKLLTDGYPRIKTPPEILPPVDPKYDPFWMVGKNITPKPEKGGQTEVGVVQ